jgi:signal transduction histidine kinase
MAEEFSSFAKMPEPKLERVNLVQVVSDAVLLLGKESDMPIEWKFASDDVHVQADPLQLGRVFTNILKNAIQSIPEGRTGEIAANLKLAGNLVVVEFKENSGMGLGLAISKKIVEQLGGRIAYKTKVGEGTTFTIELPVVQGD